MTLPRPLNTRVQQALAEPLSRSAYSLMANVVLTSILGLAFWLVAARLAPPVELGQDSALIAVLMVLTVVCQLDLGTVLTRFLPVTRRRSALMVAAAYAISLAASLLVAVAFVIVAPALWSSLAFLGRDMWLAAGFCVLMSLWAVFALQDYVLTALHRAPWVPAENAGYGLLKLAALPVLIAAGFGHAVFVAWVGPVVVLVIVVNILLFRRVIPAHERSPRESAGHAPLRGAPLLRFVIPDYLATIFNQLTPWLLPVLVVVMLGSQANAYFYIAFTVVTAFNLLFVNVSTSLMVEGVMDERRLAALTRQVARRFLLWLVLGGVVLYAAAPLILAPFGTEYATGAGGVLRLLVIAGGFRAVISLFTAIARVRRRTGWLLAAYGGLAVILLPLAVVLARPMGLDGVALAWLIAHATVAVAVLVPMLRLLRTPGDTPQAWSSEPVPLLAATAVAAGDR